MNLFRQSVNFESDNMNVNLLPPPPPGAGFVSPVQQAVSQLPGNCSTGGPLQAPPQQPSQQQSQQQPQQSSSSQQQPSLPPPPPPTTRPTSADACHSIVHSLMCHRQGGETEGFSKRAIESLVKKLKEKRDELDSLIIAITTNGSQATKCVTIQRTLDGRLQVAGRKGFPHVIYAKIWRWPDLHKNELKHIKTCQFAFELKCDFVCVNPYHYERMIPAGIDLSSLSLASQDEDIPLVGVSNMPSDQYLLHQASSPNVVKHHPQDAQDKMAAAYPLMAPNNQYNHDPLNHMNDPTVSLRQSPGDFTNLSIKTEIDIKRENCEQSTHNNYISTSPNTANTDVHQQDQKWSSHNIGNFSTNDNSKRDDPNLNHNEQWNTPTSASSSSSQALANRTPNNTSISRPLSNQPLPEYWCSISYFELDQQCGGTFKVSSSCSSVTVDGFVDPSSGNRFCLGALGNVHRSEKSEKTRLHIGKGIKLDFRGEGDVWLNCLSEHSVFLQSYYLDREAGRQPGDAIHKIYPQTYIKVFDLKQCYGQMQRQASDAHNNAKAQAYAGGGSALSYQNKSSGMAVDDLGRLCMLKLSFVKGWGPDYPRKTIKATPCWVEITLHRAMQLLDHVLHTYSIPDNA